LIFKTITEKQTGIQREVEYIFTGDLYGRYPLLGHGVRFIHSEIENTIGTAAFIEGYSWLHKPGAEVVKIKIISPALLPADKSAERIINEIMEAVELFLSDTSERIGESRIGSGKVKIWYNA